MLQVLSALDVLQPQHIDFFQEMYPLLERVRHLAGLLATVGVGRAQATMQCRALASTSVPSRTVHQASDVISAISRLKFIRSELILHVREKG